nr:MAG TPA: hypothetical protein [Caudoviricetes sp.]
MLLFVIIYRIYSFKFILSKLIIEDPNFWYLIDS